MSRRILYLHGLASSPLSTKAQAFVEHLGARGETLELFRVTRSRWQPVTPDEIFG